MSIELGRHAHAPGEDVMEWMRRIWKPSVLVVAAFGLTGCQATAGARSAGPAAPAPASTLAGSHDDRSAIVRFLGRQDVRRIAASMDIDADRLARRVDEMSPTQQARVADRARDLDGETAADSITISTTTIIVGLLVLIVLILLL